MTAEIAVTFPVVVLALAVVLFAGSVAQAGVTCVDAARAAGRAVARGDAPASAAAAAQQVAGRPVTVRVSGAGAPTGGAGGLVVVTARLEAGAVLVPAAGDAGGWRLPVTCRVRAWQEPDA